MAMECALITQDFVYPVAKVIEQQPKRDIQSQLYEFESITFDGENIHKISCQGRCFTEEIGEDISLEMVCIPASNFVMGDLDAENPYWDFMPSQHLVIELCQDRWHYDYEGAPTDGSTWSESEEPELIVFRGGSFDYYADNCRSSYRQSTHQEYRYHGMGFRVAIDAI
jgi:hypothetical protein